MLSTFIFLILTLSVLATASYGIFTLMHSTDTISMAQRNNARMVIVADRIKNAALASDDSSVYYAPMGSAGSRYTIVPKWVTMDAVSPWGVAYAYCPYAAVGITAPSGTPASVIQSDGTSYPVQVIGHAQAPASAQFVSGGTEAPADDILGFIVSSTVRKDYVPPCSEIEFEPDTASYRVPRGTVVAIKSPQASVASIGYQTVSATCDVGSSSCTARCDLGKKVLAGSCPEITAGEDSTPLSIVSFGPRQVMVSGAPYHEYECVWSAPLPQSDITMEVTCANVR